MGGQAAAVGKVVADGGMSLHAVAPVQGRCAAGEARPRLRQRLWPVADKRAQAGMQTCKYLSPGTPRPIGGWKDVAAGLLALGSTLSPAFPVRDQWQRWAECSPMTVAGAAPESSFLLSPDSLLIPGRGTINAAQSSVVGKGVSS